MVEIFSRKDYISEDVPYKSAVERSIALLESYPI